MTRRERVKTIFSGQPADRCGFWMGNPIPATWELYHRQSGMDDEMSIRRMLGDDFYHFWVSAYKHPDGRPEFDPQRLNGDDPLVFGAANVFADCEDPAEVEDFEWPNPDYLDFTETLEAMRASGDVYRASGIWSPFYHIAADLFGMEDMFIKMHTHPAVVDAVFRHICEYCLEGNRRFFTQAGDLLDGFFFANDLGTQRDLFLSPEFFDRFMFPWYQEFAAQAHAFGYQVLYHSCGAVHKLIDRFIAAGIDVLNPLQPLAAEMDAATLARDFGGRVAFLGGIDVQELLIHGTPAQIRDEVHRVMDLLGPGLVVSPGHQDLQPDIPFENIRIMAEAVVG